MSEIWSERQHVTKRRHFQRNNCNLCQWSHSLDEKSKKKSNWYLPTPLPMLKMRRFSSYNRKKNHIKSDIWFIIWLIWHFVALECNTSSHFQCPNGPCIPLSWTCDGKEDCINTDMDEVNCTTGITHSPKHFLWVSLYWIQINDQFTDFSGTNNSVQNINRPHALAKTKQQGWLCWTIKRN